MCQYYQILQQQPDSVHQFYTNLSSMVRSDGAATESAQGMLVNYIYSGFSFVTRYNCTLIGIFDDQNCILGHVIDN